MATFNSKGQVNLTTISSVIGILIAAGLVATFAGQINDDVRDDIRSDDPGTGCVDEIGNCTGAVFNVTRNTGGGLVNLSDQFGNVGTVLGAALIITVLIGAFVFFRGGTPVQFQ